MSKKLRTNVNARHGRSSGNMNLASLGLLDINSLSFGDGSGDDDDTEDGDLEAELNALVSGRMPKKNERRPNKAPTDFESLTALANGVTKDDVSDHESDYEGLESDEELLAELDELGCDSGAVETLKPTSASRSATAAIEKNVPSECTSSPQDLVGVLEIRLENYREAAAAATEINEISKVRRFARALKTLENQLSSAKLGKMVLEADIPPPVSVPKPKPPTVEEPAEPPAELSDHIAPPVPPRRPTNTYPPPEVADLLGVSDDDIEHVKDIQEPVPSVRPATKPFAPPSAPARATRLPPAASSSQTVVPPKDSTDQRSLLLLRRDQYKKAALEAKHQGNTEQALSLVQTAKQFDTVIQALEKGQPVNLSGMPPPPNMAHTSIALRSPPENGNIDDFDLDFKEDLTIYKAPPAAHTILESLQQRLAKYEETEQQAREKNNSSKARRISRIVKDYKDAIKAHRTGKKYNYEGLPAPPGFGPILLNTTKVDPAEIPQKTTETTLKKAQAVLVRPATEASPGSTAPKQPVKKQMSLTFEKQKQFLLERQKMFRDAAKEALKNGASKEQAMEYLRMSKGIQPMIDATENGLPVDLTTIPTPPQLRQDFVVLEADECGEQLSADSEELYRTLERELVAQFDTCSKNKENFFKLGDVSSATKFERLAQDTQRDLSVLKANWKRGDPLPRFHYEDRVFTIVRHNHDISENQMQVTVLRGITLPGKPNELDSYVKIDFAYPPEAPQSFRGHTVRDTTHPEYNTTCSFEVVRKSRVILRVLRRYQVKVEVWSKRGFFRPDTLLGVATIRLGDLETKCEIHDVYSLMDGRKDFGGKVEVKVRVSEPFAAKQIEEIKERWLIIGS